MSADLFLRTSTRPARGLSRRGLLAAGAALGATSLLAGCGKSEDRHAGKDGAKLSGNLGISGLSSIVSAAPFVIAAERFYSGAEVNAENVHISGGTDTVRAILSDSVGGSAATISAILAYQGGAKNLRIIGGGFNAPSVVFVGRPDSGISGPEDLKGKKIGIAGAGSPVEFFAELAIKQAGLTRDTDTEIVSVGDYGSVWPAVQDGLVDLGAVVPPLSSQLEVSKEGVIAINSADLMPTWADVAICATAEAVEQNKSGLAAWLGSVQKALDLITSDPEQAAAIWGPTLNLDDEVAVAALESVPRQAWSLEISDEFIAPAATAAVDLGLAENADIEGILDTSVLESM